MNEGGNGWINSDAWANAAGSPPISMPPFVPNVDYAIPLRLPHGRVSAVVSPHKVRILENGVLRAQACYSIAKGDIINLEERPEPLGGEPLYVASVQHEGDEFPTPIVYWRPEPKPEAPEDLTSSLSWWLGWVAMAGFTVAWFIAAVWLVWALAPWGF